MRRDHPDVNDIEPTQPLALPADTIIGLLSHHVTPARLDRIRSIISQRTRRVVPVLEGIADPHNVAAVLRSADAFGVQDVHLISPTSFAASKRVTRGTDQWLTLHQYPESAECVRYLKAHGYKIFVAAMDGKVTPESIGKERAAIVFGNEHRGVSQQMRDAADGTYAIPMRGFVESLNVSVAAAITLYHAMRHIEPDLTDTEKRDLEARLLMVCAGARASKEIAEYLNNRST